MNIESIPKFYKCPKTGENYNILGAVEYRGPSVKARNSYTIGHYVAVVRRNTNWIFYDDTKSKSSKVPNNYQLNIELLVYTKK